MREILFIAIGGATGALARHYMRILIHSLLGNSFPYGTLAVNIIGSLILGYLSELALSNKAIPVQLQIALTVGFLGAFTTFSSFSWETLTYLRSGEWLTAGANIFSNVVICILAALLGITLAKLTTAS